MPENERAPDVVVQQPNPLVHAVADSNKGGNVNLKSDNLPIPEKNGRSSASLSLVLTSVGLLVGAVVSAWSIVPGWNFVVSAACISFFVLVLGQAVSGHPFAALINERNLMSISQLQATLWSVAVISGLMALSLTRLRSANNDIAKILGSVDVLIPDQLWVMMGVSISSLVGTPLILSTKKAKDPDPKVVGQAAEQLKIERAEVEEYRQGALFANAKMSDASFADMFEGDEVGNTSHLDLAKVQMFFFTVISAIVYVVALFHAIKGGATAFPELSGGLVTLMAVSHGGYLASKLPDRSKSQPG